MGNNMDDKEKIEKLHAEWENCTECQKGRNHFCSTHDFYGTQAMPSNTTGIDNVYIEEKNDMGSENR